MTSKAPEGTFLESEPNVEFNSCTANIPENTVHTSAELQRASFLPEPDVGDGPAPQNEISDERKLLRKIDLRIMLILIELHALTFVDRLTNPVSGISGVGKSLPISPFIHTWTDIGFHLAVVILALPVALGLQRFSLVHTLTGYVVIWGLLFGLHSVPGLNARAVLRPLLGIVDCGIPPAFVILMSQWYKREEVLIRVAVWYAFDGLLTTVMSTILLLFLGNAASIAITTWQFVFISVGITMVLCGIALFLSLPQSPRSASFLSESERSLAVKRLVTNQQGACVSKFDFSQLRSAFSDVQIYSLCAISMNASFINEAIARMTALLTTHALTTKGAVYTRMIQGLVLFLICTLFALCYRIFPRMSIWAGGAGVLTVGATCIVTFSPLGAVTLKIFGMLLCSLNVIPLIFCWTALISNVAGHTKKLVASALVLVAYSLGYIAVSLTFALCSPSVLAKIRVLFVLAPASIVLSIGLLWWNYTKKNTQRTTTNATFTNIELDNEVVHTPDLTDNELVGFRYVL